MKVTDIEKPGKLDEKNVGDIFTLTPMQQGMLYHYLKDPGSDLYFEQLCLYLSGEINARCFEKAWDFVIDINEMLRAVFRWEKLEKPVQIVLKKHQFQPVYYDLSDKNGSETEKCLQEITVKDKKKKFLLEEIPFRVTLCKARENNYMMIISNHHILYDGWSNGILLKEFFNAYNDLYNGKKLVKPIKTRFKEFIKWVHQQGTDTGKQEEYWTHYLKGFDTPTQLSIKKIQKRKITGIKNFRIHLEKEMTIRLERFIKQHKLTLASLLYCAWGLLLQKYNNSDDVILGTTVSGRSAPIPGIEKIVGLFINTLPLRLTTHSHEKLEDLLTRTYHSLQTRKEYETASLVKINRLSQLNDREVLFDTLMVIENYPLDIPLLRENNTLTLNSYSMFEMTNYDLTVGIWLSAEIEVNFIYRRQLFDDDDIKRLANHFRALTENITEFPGKRPPEIEIMSAAEKRTVLHTFNDTAADYPEDKTLQQLFEKQVERTPGYTALIGQIPNKEESRGRNLNAYSGVHLSYSQLNARSNQLACLLIEKGIRADTIVGMMVERSIEMIVGIMGILKAGGAYLPIDPNYPVERLQYMLEDSESRLLLTQEKFAGDAALNAETLCIDNQSLYRAHSKNPPKQSTPANLFYMIYTSGSTGRAKGVMVTINSFINLLHWFTTEFNIDSSDRILLIAPISFDLAQKNLFTSFIKGGSLCLAPPQFPAYHRLSGIIAKEKITVINCSPSVFYPLIQLNSNHDFVKLKSLRWVFLGGEAIQGDKLARWLDSGYCQCEIVNTYGPTECTDIASSYRVNPRDIKERKNIPIGKPIYNVTLFVLDRHHRLLPVGIVGELCIGGVGLSKGYYKNPQLTAEKFKKVVITPSTQSAIYFTGDLARWLPDGNIEFSGRIDHQVKIRGFRVELGEIENRLLEIKKIKEAVVCANHDKKGDKYLCAYIVPHTPGDFNIARLPDDLSQKLPAYMIPSYFVTLDNIPLSPNGKVDRKSLPQPVLKAGEKDVPPAGEVEEKLAAIWAKVLELDKEIIAVGSNFFRLGGHSLNAIALMSKIQQEFNLPITLAEIFKTPDIRNLSAYIKRTVKDKAAPGNSPQPSEKREYYLLSSAQKRLYMIQQIDPGSTLYNMSTVLNLQVNLQKEKLVNSLQQVIHRHESLRTSFDLIEEEPVQEIHDKMQFDLEYYNLATEGVAPPTYYCSRNTQIPEEKSWNENKVLQHSNSEGTRGLAPLSKDPTARSPQPAAALINSFIRPFTLWRLPLLRVRLVKVQEDNHLLMADMHHIISDETSCDILLKELVHVYLGKSLPGLKLQYKDYAQWQNSRINSNEMKKQEEYWLNRFKGNLPRLEIPTDYPRPTTRNYEGRSIEFDIPPEEAGKLRELAKKENATMFMVGLAICNILLYKITKHDDVVVGTLTAGRKHADLKNIIGFFVNTLAMRHSPRPGKSFIQFLREVRKKTLDAFDNQDYQFDELVEQVVVKREAGRNPLFDTLFTFISLGVKKSSSSEETVESIGADLKLRVYEGNQSTQSKFDLIFFGQDNGEVLSFVVTYPVDLFKKRTVETFIEYFKTIVSTVSENKNIQLKDIKVSHNLGIAAAQVYEPGKIKFEF